MLDTLPRSPFEEDIVLLNKLVTLVEELISLGAPRHERSRLRPDDQKAYELTDGETYIFGLEPVINMAISDAFCLYEGFI